MPGERRNVKRLHDEQEYDDLKERLMKSKSGAKASVHKVQVAVSEFSEIVKFTQDSRRCDTGRKSNGND